MADIENFSAKGMSEGGQSDITIAIQFGKSKSVFSRLVACYRQRGGVKIGSVLEKPRETTNRQERHLQTIVLRNRFVSASKMSDNFRATPHLLRLTV